MKQAKTKKLELKGEWLRPDRLTLAKVLLPNGRECRVLAPDEDGGVSILPARCCVCDTQDIDSGMRFLSICAECLNRRTE